MFICETVKYLLKFQSKESMMVLDQGRSKIVEFCNLHSKRWSKVWSDLSLQTQSLVLQDSCSVASYTDQHKSLHWPSVSEDISAEGMMFIFDGNIPITTGEVCVCANPFTSESQYKAMS